MQNSKHNPLGSYIRDKREAAGISLRAVAGSAGISVTFLSELELGTRSCRPHTLTKIARGMTANRIPTTQKQLVALFEADRIEKLKEELAELERRNVS